MGRLQSGLLLFETPQGLVSVELSFRDRLYMLWTFRNFRRLSTLLLNSRENSLINTLYRNNSGITPDSYDPATVIGVVEDYVPATEVDAVVSQEKKRQPEKKRRQNKKRRHTPVAPLPAEIAPTTVSEHSTSPRTQWPADALAKLIAATPAELTPAKALAKTSRFTMSRLLTSFGAFSLCVVSLVAWHRIEAVPSSEAENRPDLQQISAMAPASAPQVADPVVPLVTPQGSEPIAVPSTNSTDAIPHGVSATPNAPQAEAKPRSVAAVVPTPSIPVSGAPKPSLSAREVPAPIIATSIEPTRVSKPQPTATHNHVSTRTVPASTQNATIQVTRPPLRYVYPEYSDVRVRGVVTLTAGVDSDGMVRTVKVVTGNRALAAAAVRAVRQWRYRPYLKDGQPIATETNIVISFISDDAVSMSFPSSIPVSR